MQSALSFSRHLGKRMKQKMFGFWPTPIVLRNNLGSSGFVDEVCSSSLFPSLSVCRLCSQNGTTVLNKSAHSFNCSNEFLDGVCNLFFAHIMNMYFLSPCDWMSFNRPLENIVCFTLSCIEGVHLSRFNDETQELLNLVRVMCDVLPLDGAKISWTQLKPKYSFLNATAARWHLHS